VKYIHSPNQQKARPTNTTVYEYSKHMHEGVRKGSHPFSVVGTSKHKSQKIRLPNLDLAGTEGLNDTALREGGGLLSNRVDRALDHASPEGLNHTAL